MNDLITHKCIRQEPQVSADQIAILYEDQQLLAVNKPPSIPVHSSGSYNYNTVNSILKFEQAISGLYSLHRIDRLTSGVLIFAKQKEHCIRFHQHNRQKKINKLYLARVDGDFSQTVVDIKKHIICEDYKKGTQKVTDDETQQSTYAQTVFEKIWYDKDTDTSLLRCKPITGKTHQIRVHLQWLGYPILNDLQYGGRYLHDHRYSYHGSHQNISSNQQQSSYPLYPQQTTGLYHKVKAILLHSYCYEFDQKVIRSTVPEWAQPNTEV